MFRKKLAFLFLILFVIVPVFSLALVSPVSAVSVGVDCSTDTCDSGLSCARNPYKGATTLPAGVPSWDTAADKVCCSTLWGCLGQEGVEAASGLGNKDPREVAANVVNIVLGFLGIIAVILILLGGFMWMTAAGNEEKVGTAKKLMAAGAIGLVIVLAAFGIAKFVIGALFGATT